MTYNEACQDFETRWRIAYETIRCLCRSHPAHDNLDIVTAKVWIINGTYTVQLARALAAGGEDVQRLQSFAEFLCRRHTRVDMILNGIADMDEPLTCEKLQRIVAAHGKFVKPIAPRLRDNNKATSFCSKYMHFHNEIVPLYDSLAVKALTVLFRRQRASQSPTNVDGNYHRFAWRFLNAYAKLDERGMNPKVRLMDWWLISSGNNPSTEPHPYAASFDRLLRMRGSHSDRYRFFQ
jgi:hypothetical protein